MGWITDFQFLLVNLARRSNGVLVGPAVPYPCSLPSHLQKLTVAVSACTPMYLTYCQYHLNHDLGSLTYYPVVTYRTTPVRSQKNGRGDKHQSKMTVN